MKALIPLIITLIISGCGGAPGDGAKPTSSPGNPSTGSLIPQPEIQSLLQLEEELLQCNQSTVYCVQRKLSLWLKNNPNADRIFLSQSLDRKLIINCDGCICRTERRI